MKAVQIQDPKVAIVAEVPEPKLRPTHVKVKNVAIALNPTDWKHVDFIGDKGGIVGCDFAGEVVELGSEVKSDVKPGDKIAGLVHGSNLSNHEDGAFGEYLVVKDGMFLKVPDNLSMQAAATLGVGVATVGQGIYQALGAPLPGDTSGKPFTVLIYGGSTATGALAIQYAKLSGLEVITTASKHNHEYLKSLGADQVFDYRSPTCGADIRKATNNNLRHCLDCISLSGSMEICAEALSSDTSTPVYYASLLATKGFPRSDIQTRVVNAYTSFGEKYTKFGVDKAAVPADYEYAVKFWALSEKLFKEGKLEVHRPQIGGKGLEGALEGMDLMRNDKVSGVKLVYNVADTPGISA